ncbi:MAG TPA: alkaline phosphatase D family protein [Candidatus Hydrogenedentes bacterium]|nr:alkaline phosphatase D family protein [Candidatus Hydrogenedentota bacterium]HPG65892.1 alkaline phosphatase D family protein [Candidatus Hydrogenedentota bacterium]
MRLLGQVTPVMIALAATVATAAAAPILLETDQYKRVHVQALEAVLNGNVEGAVRALEAYDAAHSDDPETPYLLAIAATKRDDLEGAMAQVREALDRGLDIGRFLAGPRSLFAKLLETNEFRAMTAERLVEPIHGPMVGSLTDCSARIWVRTSAVKPVHVLVSRTEDLDDAQRFDADYGESAFHTALADITGLEPDTRYYYKVVVADVDGRVHSFKTCPKEGEPATFTIAFGGGAGYVPQHERMWDTILGFAPLAFLFLGDNVYIDHPTYPEIQEYCYYRRQSRPEFRRFVASCGISAIYDDHDFGDNDCWGGPAMDEPNWKRPAWRLFRANWANPQYGGGDARPGCWFDCAIADVRFFFLDCRYYRTDPKEPNPSMLGPVQKKWFLDAVTHSNATFNVLASSVPWAIGTKPNSLDTWDGYAAEREAIFAALEAADIGGVILLSADRHRSDVWHIERADGYDFYEFESSRLTNQHVHKKIPGADFSYNESQSFGLLEFDTTAPDPEIAYTIVNIDGERIHTTRLHRSQLMAPAESSTRP